MFSQSPFEQHSIAFNQNAPPSFADNEQDGSAQTDLATVAARRIDTTDTVQFQITDGSKNPPLDLPLADHKAALEDDLHQFFNGDIDATQLEQSLINFQRSLTENGIETPHSISPFGLLVYQSDVKATPEVISGVLEAQELPGVFEAFSHMSPEAQIALTKDFLLQHSPVEIFGERLIQALEDFKQDNISSQELEAAILTLQENLNTDTTIDSFSGLSRTQQEKIAQELIDSAYLSSDEFALQQRHQIAAHILLPDNAVAAERIAQQSIYVETLLARLSPSSSITEAETQWLTRELTTLGKLRAEAGIPTGTARYDDGLFARYTMSNLPPERFMIGRRLDDLPSHYTRHIPIEELTASELHRWASDFNDQLVKYASNRSLDHEDVFGTIPPSQLMRILQNRLTTAQTVPSDVDTDQVYQINMTVAQLRLVEGDLQNYEYRLTAAARAVLGNDAWDMDRDYLYSAHEWIEEEAVLSRLEREQSRDGGSIIPRSPEELRFVDAWNNSSRETRIEYLGFDVETWNQASPLLDYARFARKQRKDAEFGLDDLIKIGFGIFISAASANSLGPAVATWLSSTGVIPSGVAGLAGSVIGSSVGTLLSTLVTSGDWVTARESFKDVFEGNLKEGIAELVFQYLNLDPQYAGLLDAGNSDELKDQLTQRLALDIVQKFGDTLIDEIKEFTPDVVDNYLEDFSALLEMTDDPEEVADHAIGYWGAELANAIGINNNNGIRLITSLLEQGVNYGELDVDALRRFFGAEIQGALQGLPAQVVERLGGTDSTLALLAGVATRISVDNIDVAINGDSFLDAATNDLEIFVENIAIDWVEQGGLENALSFIPHAENWTPQFRELVLEGHGAGWNRDFIQAHLSESPLFSNLLNSYVPGGFAHDMLSEAIHYGADNGWDTQTIINAAAVDVIDIIGNAGISQDIVRFLGGDSALISQATNVFGQRLIANNGDLDQTLRDMEAYARGLGAGIVGEFLPSVLQQLLGPGATQAVDALAGLAIGHATGWSNTERDNYVQQHILAPLGQEGVALIRAVFGHEDNFITDLLATVTDAYATSEGDEGAARSAGLSFLVNRLSGLTGGINFSGQDGLALPPSPASLPGAIINLIQHAQDNNWNRDAITSYVEDQFLNHELGSTLLNSLTGVFGNRTEVASALVEELIDVWQDTEDPIAVVESLVKFLMDPPTIAPNNTTGDAGQETPINQLQDDSITSDTVEIETLLAAELSVVEQSALEEIENSLTGWTTGRSDLLEINQILDSLTLIQKNKVIANLSDEKLQNWGDEIDDFIGGLNDAEQVELYTSLTNDLVRDQLARVYEAFGTKLFEKLDEQAVNGLNTPTELTAEERELYLDLAQMSLDIVGIFDPTFLSDGINTLTSVLRGKWLDAGLSAISMVPYIGDLAKAGKLGSWAQTIDNVIRTAVNNSEFANAVAPVLSHIADAIDSLPTTLPSDVLDGLGAVKTKIDDGLTRTVSFATGVPYEITRDSLTPGGRYKGRLNAGPNTRHFKRFLAADTTNNKINVLADGSVKYTGVAKDGNLYAVTYDPNGVPDFTPYSRGPAVNIEVDTAARFGVVEESAERALRDADYANASKALWNEIKHDLAAQEQLKSALNDFDVTQLADGIKPEGFTWHHAGHGLNADGTGSMMLVEFAPHDFFKHRGWFSFVKNGEI